MANIIESRVTLEDEVFEETIDTAEEPIEVVRPTSYNDLQDLPQINGVTLQGNKTSSDLGIVTQNDINSAVSAEATLRENADTALGGRIDQEITDRGNADTALGGRIDGEIMNRTNADNALGTRIDNEILARQGGDNNLQTQIDAITSKSDVVDVVADYAALQAYDTQHLGNNDVIKVLDDETHDDAQTYYRWNKTAGTWSYIGSEAPYYSKGQMDTMLQAKQDKIDATHKLSADLVDDTSTTNKFVTAEDKTTWNTKQNALTAGQGIDITSDVISTPALVPEVVASLPAEGTEGKLYLTPKAHTTQTATGNPIEATVTEQAGQLESFQLDGDTFQQSYTGKNLYNIEAIPYVWRRAYSSTGEELSWTGYVGTDAYQPVEPNTQYALWNNKIGNTTYLCEYDENKNFIQRSIAVSQFTTTATTKYLRWSLSVGDGEIPPTQTQLELGSQTAYEPYVGGQPSPNPSYPQDINVVTGTQTISINGTNYPLDLGDIQLCGLGDDGNGNPLYKDRIYRDGDDWKVHKELGNVTLDSTYYNSRYGTNSYGLTQFLVELGVSDYYDESGYVTMLSNPFTKQTTSFSNTQVQGFLPALDSNSHKLRAWIRISTTTADTIDQFKAWLNTNTPIFYYKLDTATDTTITDTTLIAQLEAIRTASLQNGANTITNTATGSNLAGDMEIGYFGFNPTNRYDKFIWLDLNNNYEQIGS